MQNSDSIRPYASLPENSRGRLLKEPESKNRTAFQRDRDRIIHSVAFRRLQYKTQVFVYHEGDHFRTRLTHSLEVAQIARSLSRTLGVNEDLAETIALAHDLGHTPFGHAGEDALHEMMLPFDGFDHNEQTFRVVTQLERRYADFNGLNLSWESLEGIAKHNGPVAGPLSKEAIVPESMRKYCTNAIDLELASFAGLEAQIAAISDDIAYNNHDIDDGIRAGLFKVGDLLDLPVVGDIFREVEQRYPNVGQESLVHEAVRRLVDHMISDVLAETGRRLEQAMPQSVIDVRAQPQALVAFSDQFKLAEKELRAFLFGRMYRHEKVKEMRERVKQVVRNLFSHYSEHPEGLPDYWRLEAGTKLTKRSARLIADYIAGMTDRYAFEQHRQIFNLDFEIK
ncbi:deoxyguanosinetriphosphate triphosphohydrolase [Kiloniella laminariae]|uniref:Deoxyguanosinetriphosphate triphosphohydrolase-like protein n=1 Tax=Kiloniella laminariae TaxID=454162 RepID=A0ABT4LNB4_9PROT|nr:deoxyguanosinetriphosphate triphosphohydrolase [Kiloniella laminariae]MCZ4282637.1 deoxyguanosinetriphosphate triphosphohydrolase [Kiloniella laminariae]